MEQPFQSLSIDTIGPLPEDQFGNKYIVVAIDDLTRFAELRAVKDTSAESACEFLFDIFCRYGAFKECRSDQSTQFVNRLIEQFLARVGTEQRFSVAYDPKAMGRVERKNAEVMRHLRALVFDPVAQERWSAQLPLVQRIVNSVPNATTGIAPATLLYTERVDPNRGIFKQFPSGSSDQPNYHVYLQNLIVEHDRLIKASVEHQKKVTEKYLEASPEDPLEFKVGESVLVSYPERPPSKFHPRWQGPFKVAKVEGNRYTCTNLRTGKDEVFDIQRLRRYISDPDRDDLSVASVDRREYVVERILAHRGTSKKKSKMMFKVHWEGYDDSKDSWEPYSSVKDLAALDVYVEAHPGLNL